MENDVNVYLKNIKRLYNEIWEKKIYLYKDRLLKVCFVIEFFEVFFFCFVGDGRFSVIL